MRESAAIVASREHREHLPPYPTELKREKKGGDEKEEEKREKEKEEKVKVNR